MSLQVLVMFPDTMSLGDFESRLHAISGMGCTLHLGTNLTKPIGQVNVGKSKALPAFETAEALTANEESIIDQVMEKVHREGSSPLLDAMTQARVGKLKPNMSREIIAYYKEHPGHTTAQCAVSLADKFEAHYKDINDAFKRIRNLINTMSYAKGPQRSLEKRGGKPGRGNDAQVFVLAEAA